MIGLSSETTAWAITSNLNPASNHDSLTAVFDIYSPDRGTTWCAALLGYPWTFRGTFLYPGGTDLTEDNRVNASVNYAGDKVFFTWIDTQLPDVTDNNNPDVFTEAYCATASYYTFSMGEFDYIPIVTELLDPDDVTQPVTFKYIPDFAYQDGDYTIGRPSCSVPFPVAVDNKKTELEISIYPNPVTDIAVMKVNMTEGGNVQICLTNMLGQSVMNLDKGYVAAGNQQFTFDSSRLIAGIYFATVQIDGEKYTQKVVVE